MFFFYSRKISLLKERDFIEKNNNRWQAFESEIKKAKADPRLTTKSYIEMMDDLSYSRTHYPNRLVRSYLNGVAQMLSVIIYRSEKNLFKKAKDFWLIDLPLVMYQSRKQLLISLLIFLSAMAIGVFSSINDPDFARTILGEGYVNMTIENIEKGDPMAVYKDKDASQMFLGITQNNILVSLRTYVMGFFLGIGTLIILFYNGIMVGVFQYFFVERGLFWESFLTIWQHGALEISSIVIAGCAGLVLGQGVFFPSSFSRIDGLRMSGRKSIMIAVGLIPIFIMAGAIESFVTRLTDLHWILRLSNIVLSFSFIVYYFVLYPRKVAKLHRIENRLRMNTLPIMIESYDRSKVYSMAQTFAQTIFLMLQKSKTTFWGMMILAAALGGFALVFAEELTQISEPYFAQVYNPSDLFVFGLDIYRFSAAALILAGIVFIGIRLVSRLFNPDDDFWQDVSRYFVWALITGVVSAFVLSWGYSLIVFFVFWPLMMIVGIEAVDTKAPVFSVVGDAWQGFKSGFWRHMGNTLICFIAFFSIQTIYESLLSPQIQNAIMFFIPLDEDIHNMVQTFVFVFGWVLLIGFVFLFWIVALFYNHLAVKEAYNSFYLREKAEQWFEPKNPVQQANFSKAGYHKI